MRSAALLLCLTLPPTPKQKGTKTNIVMFSFPLTQPKRGWFTRRTANLLGSICLHFPAVRQLHGDVSGAVDPRRHGDLHLGLLHVHRLGLVLGQVKRPTWTSTNHLLVLCERGAIPIEAQVAARVCVCCLDYLRNLALLKCCKVDPYSPCNTSKELNGCCSALLPTTVKEAGMSSQNLALEIQ